MLLCWWDVTDEIDRIDGGVPQIDAFEVRLDVIEHLVRLRRVDRLERAGHAYC